MPRANTIETMSVVEIEHVNRVIRFNRYRSLDATISQLKESGIEVSQSALGRYVLKLKREDGLMVGPDDNTIITIVERHTGKIRVVKTAATAEAVALHIEALAPIEKVV